MINAVLDACVLYSVILRGLLLRLADAGLFCPFWSEEIQNEWTRNLLQRRPDLKRENLERICQKMIFTFPDGLVRGYESITPILSLPDSTDKHVLAVAIHSESKYIVTHNLNDFPKSALQPYEIEAVSPDEFVMQLIRKDPNHVLQAANDHRSSLTRPALMVDEYLETLEVQGLSETVAFLREHTIEI